MRKTALYIVLPIVAALAGILGYFGQLPIGHANPDPAKVVQGARQSTINAGFEPGSPLFVRIFKESAELEVWLADKTGSWRHYKTFPICYFSGKLGPKLKEGDKQSPEGFYQVGNRQMNPKSRYHLSFNLGFPNRFDRQNGRTGSFLMVHGSCVSIGCYAMTNKGIEEIYGLASAALAAGQKSFSVHIYPFRMNETNMKRHRQSKWYGFWQQLKPAYDSFERSRKISSITAQSGRYVIAAEK